MTLPGIYEEGIVCVRFAKYRFAGVKFLIGQIGSSEEAIRFLNTLKKARDDNPEIAKVLYIHAGMFHFCV